MSWTSPAKVTALLFLTVALSGCLGAALTPSELKQIHATTDRHFMSAKPHVKPSHLNECAKKIKNRWTSLTATLVGELKPNRKLTCDYVNRPFTISPKDLIRPANSHYIVYSAQIRLQKGNKTEINPTVFLWCRFRENDGKVTLERWNEKYGVSSDLRYRQIARACGMNTWSR